MTDPPQAPKASSLFGGIGGLLQVVTAGGITATVFGLFAMYVQFKRYEIPMSLLSLDQAARAGALPTAIFIVIVTYGYLAVKFHSFAALGVMTAALLPMFLAAIPFMGIVIGILLGYCAAFVWLFQMVFKLFPINDALSDDRLSFIAANACVAGIFLLVAFFIWYERRITPHAAKSTDRVGGIPSQEAESSTRTEWLIISVLVVAMPVTVIAFYPLRWYLSNLGATEFATDVLSTGHILISGVIVFFAMAGIIPIVLLSTHKLETNYRLRYIAVGVASVIFLASLVLYCGWLYPMIPSAFGGGRPERITIWIKAEDFSEDARQRLHPASCTEIAKVVRCDDVDSLPVGDSYVALTTKEQPTLVVSRQSVKSFVLSSPPLNAKPLE